jgi:hypothetical protein
VDWLHQSGYEMARHYRLLKNPGYLKIIARRNKCQCATSVVPQVPNN